MSGSGTGAAGTRTEIDRPARAAVRSPADAGTAGHVGAGPRRGGRLLRRGAAPVRAVRGRGAPLPDGGETGALHRGSGGEIARNLGARERDLGTAGLKDKRAVSVQRISVLSKATPEEALRLQG